ncbi:MAG TPA: rhomboid family intramembrane serine protease [Jatrophihabitans sp.]|nr:rhomboid family intramembrane serine protease [Jatrophihabitans sp.]
MRPASVGFHCPDDVSEGSRTVRAPRTSVGARIWQSRPYVTTSLIALNVIVYVVTAVAPGASFTDPGAGATTGKGIFFTWQLMPFAVHFQHRYYELITSAFLHVGLLHILSNMLALAFIGPALEQLLGRWRFAAVYVLSALGGSAAIYAFGNELTPTVGASGAIFGLFGVCLVLVRKLGLDLQWLLSIVAINFLLTFSIHGISKLGHIGGFITGMLAGLAIGGLPSLRTRLPTRVQAAGLAGLLVLLIIVVAVRSATW